MHSSISFFRGLSALAAAGALLLTPPPVAAQPFAAMGVDLLSQINLAQFGSASGNGCWGYTSPSGREYAIMGLNNMAAFVEITNPTNPVIVATVAHNSSVWADIKTYQRFAYISNESGGGLQVVDLQNIDTGAATLVRSVTSNGLTHNHTVALNEASGFVYVCGSNATGSNGGLVAFSLADPSNPVFAGQWNTHYIHEAQVVSYTTGPYAGREIAFCACEGNGLFIVDVTNKAAMVTLGSTVYPGVQYSHQGWLSENRRYFYLDDELDGPAQGVTPTLTRIFDVSNLSTPTLVGTFTSSAPGSIDHNLYIRGRYAYESNYRSGLRVFDLINPLAPVEVAWIDTYPENDAAGYDGTWSNYPFFPSGSIIISDINRGLFVVRLNLNYLHITLPDGPPVEIPAAAPFPIRAHVSQSGASILDGGSVMLWSRVGAAGVFTSSPMLPAIGGGGDYIGHLPATPCRETVFYYVAASTTNAVGFTSPLNAPAEVYSARAISGRVVLLEDHIETPGGWIAGLATDTAVTGAWEFGDPEPTGAQPGDDHTPGPGVNCFVTGRLAGPSIGSFDVDGGLTTLLSPLLDLTGAGPDASIGYWRWYSNSAGAAPNADIFRVDASADGGSTWTSVEVVGPSGPDVSGGWIRHEFRVADVVAPSATIRLRFIAEDAGSGSIIEAAIDDLSIFRYDCAPPCRADFNTVGGVSVQDIFDYLSAWFAQDPYADFNGVGGLTVQDIFDFLAAWFVGC